MSDWDVNLKPLNLLNRAARLVSRIGESRLRALSLGVGQVPVLAALKDGAALSQKALTDIAVIEQPSMAQLLARMERDGLVGRQSDPKDGRVSLFSLTPLALGRLPEARAILAQANAAALEGLSDEERMVLIALLQRVVDNVEALRVAPP